MRKKLTLVALFCGALCLTGCLKSGEESPSVTQVRNAYAAQLNSIAELNKAKAQAELIYANADATLKTAEAELKLAEAALVRAKAETETYYQQLLALKAKLAQAQLDEEAINLQIKIKELEVKTAQAEAAIAQAEAAKEYWTNQLIQLQADAEKAAIENALAIQKAKDEFDAYIITQESAKADSAKVYADKYFKALDKVAKLQAQEVAAKVAQKLLNYGAKEAREIIIDEMIENNNVIDENNRRIAYLKQYQAEDPETIQAELLAAKKELNEAYTAYQDARTAEGTAKTKFETAAAVKSTYVDDWDNNFGKEVKALITFMNGNQNPKVVEYARCGASDNYYVDEETNVKYNAFVVFDEDGEVVEKLPLWTAKAQNPNGEYNKEQYFEEPLEPSVVNGIKVTPSNNLKSRTYYPAKIEFDNVETLFTAFETGAEIVLDALDEDLADYTAAQKVIDEAFIKESEETLKLYEEYVAARKADVEAAEQAVIDAIPGANETEGVEDEAYAAYREYMTVKYDVNRSLFEKRYDAKKAYEAAVEDSLEWENKLVEIEASIPELKAEWEAAKLDAEYAHGVALKVKDEMDALKETYNTAITTANYAGAQTATEAAKATMDEKWEALQKAKELQALYEGYEKPYPEGVQTVAEAQEAYNKAKGEYNDAVSHEAAAKAIDTQANKDIQQADKYIQHAQDLYEEASEKASVAGGKYGSAVRDLTNVKEVEEVFFNEDGTFYTNPEGGTAADVRDLFKGKAEDKLTKLEKAEDALLTKLAEKLGVEKEDIASTEDPEADRLYKAWKDARAIEGTGEDVLWEKFSELQAVYNRLDQDRRDRPGAERYYHNFNYIRASYQLDADYQYISGYEWDAVNETYKVVKSFYHGGETDPKTGEYIHGDRSRSLGAQVEDKLAELADEETYAATCKALYIADPVDGLGGMDLFAMIKEHQDKVAEVRENLAKYEAVEEAYVASVKDRNETYAAWLDAQLNTKKVQAEYNEAKAKVQALEDAANQWIYVYDPIDPATNKNETGYVPDGEGFVKLPIAAEIKRMEKQNAELQATNDNYTKLLKAGKITVEYVNGVLDEIIGQLEEAVKIYTAIANKYKAVMEAYLPAPVNEEEEDEE